MFDVRIRKTTIKFFILGIIQFISIVYLYIQIGNKQVDERVKSGVALTGLFVLTVFLMALGKVIYSKTAENNLKKKETEKLQKYDTANTIQWTCMIICFWIGGYFYAIREDISYFGICSGVFIYFLYHYPSFERFKTDFNKN